MNANILLLATDIYQNSRRPLPKAAITFGEGCSLNPLLTVMLLFGYMLWVTNTYLPLVVYHNHHNKDKRGFPPVPMVTQSYPLVDSIQP